MATWRLGIFEPCNTFSCNIAAALNFLLLFLSPGRGRCCSGICECFNKTSVTGRFCECDVCPRSEDGQICGGKDHGKCVCGRCECTDEWTGSACDCTKDIEACRSPQNGLICHGFGECICGKCYCFEKYGYLHRGRFCQDCGRCPLMTCRRCLEFY